MVMSSDAQMPHQDSMYKPYEPGCTSYKSKYRMVWILCVWILFNILDCLIFMDDMVTYQNRVHYTDVIMDTIASQITSLTIVYSAVLDADQRKYQVRVTGLCVGNSPETGEFPPQMASNAENLMTSSCLSPFTNQMTTAKLIMLC